MQIWVLSDGKPGHYNQSLGLADALLRKVPSELTVIDLEGQKLLEKLSTVVRQHDKPKPDLIIAAGHGTHLPLIKAAKRYRAVSVVCMKPSLPSFLFGLCVVPRHDLDPDRQYFKPNFFPTIGAMHRIHPAPDDPAQPRDRTLIMIGGPSKEHGWNPHLLKELLIDYIEPFTEGDIVLTTSRRTPEDFVSMFKKGDTDITIVPVDETYPGWVAEQLSRAKAAWVTEDSVSMVYEALGAGCPVGVIPMPREISNRSRVAYGLSLLIKEKRVVHLDEWVKTKTFHYQDEPLLEADRVAAHIIKTYPHLVNA